MFWLQVLAVSALLPADATAHFGIARPFPMLAPRSHPTTTRSSITTPSLFPAKLRPSISPSSTHSEYDSSATTVSPSIQSSLLSAASVTQTTALASNPSTSTFSPGSETVNGFQPTPDPSGPTSSIVAHSISHPMKHKTLTIVLSTVLPALALLLVAACFLFARFRAKGRVPFARASKGRVTPIDDDEIATWRGNTQPMAQTRRHYRQSSSIVFTPVGESRSSANAFLMTTRRGGDPVTPPPVARAPNARSGLTDAAIPGDEPFIPPLKRQNSKISKRQQTGHGRNKSGRSSSSFSTKEGPGAAPPYDMDPESAQRHLRDDSKGSRKGSFARPSFLDGRGAELTSDAPSHAPAPPSAPQAVYSGHDKEVQG
ncbi:MAG: hypothetical protein M1818_005851 [Claussenomyces sp. TS43310]|nr:MAG: hypothetical protein M1818_005851 [Claussenomyces sp. TS43310]